ncbi:hypothetical protein SynMVIR181_00287 [Synechococcus sp. MVIR-18-1]|nr:hypothetical protein SynMVIR181_00287 [Synechococcus sp. MVIR-18-1]
MTEEVNENHLNLSLKLCPLPSFDQPKRTFIRLRGRFVHDWNHPASVSTG